MKSPSRRHNGHKEVAEVETTTQLSKLYAGGSRFPAPNQDPLVGWFSIKPSRATRKFKRTWKPAARHE